MAVGLNQQKNDKRRLNKTLSERRAFFDYQTKKEVPSGRDAQVVVAVVIPVVVDVETLRIEVADVDTVAVRIYIICLSSSMSLEIEVYFSLKAELYPLFPVFYSGADNFRYHLL
ncbi:MAG: hypothetical protein A2Z68_02685 [Candidatus Nealsonbacteria bacterium RBG_13_38_11]|uniref:Uncharacterized protein n=1 Tax=Candidatus Nealsonbacteria bacterium RBG_13_38_11 TaxID=1801662 RepID=A0A1G2DZM2_9BACT|nr:MAG: hypothetical protein A2Z68_02685 [Candidatus Nealsonbacteria bacterium RBG_13_38_11]